MISKDEEIELYKQSIQEADEIIAELKYRNKELKKINEKYKQFIKWLSTQQYYILPKNIKEKIKEVLSE